MGQAKPLPRRRHAAAPPHACPLPRLPPFALRVQAGGAAGATPIVTFNAELDRIRTGYYPPLFYPAIGKIAKSLIPNFTTAYYIKARPTGRTQLAVHN